MTVWILMEDTENWDWDANGAESPGTKHGIVRGVFRTEEAAQTVLETRKSQPNGPFDLSDLWVECWTLA